MTERSESGWRDDGRKSDETSQRQNKPWGGGLNRGFKLSGRSNNFLNDVFHRKQKKKLNTKKSTQFLQRTESPIKVLSLFDSC